MNSSGVNSGFNTSLHNGHVVFAQASQSARHDVWKQCPHRVSVEVDKVIASKQMGQQFESIVLRAGELLLS